MGKNILKPNVLAIGSIAGLVIGALYTVVLFFFSSSLFIAYADTCVSTGQVSHPAIYWQGEQNGWDLLRANELSLRNGLTFAAGKVGDAFVFDGVDDYADTPYDSRLNFTRPTTLTAWINPTTLSQESGFDRRIMGKIPPSNSMNAAPFDLLVNSANSRLELHLGNGATYQTIAGTSTIPTAAWTHVAASWNGTEVKIYVNGVLETTAAQTVTPSAATTGLALGRWMGSNAGRWQGKIDEVGIYDRELSATDLAQIVAASTAGICFPDADGDGVFDSTDLCPNVAGASPSGCPSGNPMDLPASAVGYWSFDETSGTTITEPISGMHGTERYMECVAPHAGLTSWFRAQGNANDSVSGATGTATGATTTTAGVAGYAFAFNGVDQRISVPDNAAWNFGASDFTMEWWMKTTNVSTEEVVFMQGDAAGTDAAFRVDVNGGGAGKLRLKTGVGWANSLVTDGPV
ncbi:hypothetical protein COW46_01675, partial [Candidatus Gracilibacteria bacterium CG17_big_fil_post_rev_8_21_14_2_50_48_13]